MPFSPKLIRIVRRLILSLAIFATLIALAIVIENWRGNRAWKKYAAEHSIKGVTLDALPGPSKLPPETNFFKTPVLDRWVFEHKTADFLQKIQSPEYSSIENIKKWTRGTSPDFADYVKRISQIRTRRNLPEITLTSTTTPAGQLLQLLAPMEPVLFELRQAAKQRPESQLARPTALDWKNPFTRPTPDYYFARTIATTLSIHAAASLTERQIAVAFDDTLAGLKFSRGFTSAPDTLLIEALTGSLLYLFTLQPVWQGQQQHAWNAEQLLAFQKEIGQADLVDSLSRSFETEQTEFLCALDNVQTFTWGEAFGSFKIFPHGWLQQNKITACELLASQRAVSGARATPDFLNKLLAPVKYPPGFGSPFSPYTLIAAISIPGYEKTMQNVVDRQSFLTLAATACALERHWLAHGNYPETLAELVPTYLDKVPLDIVNGDPLRYWRNDNGRFTLYSIGLDGKDDGGDLKKDWTWPQPAETR